MNGATLFGFKKGSFTSVNKAFCEEDSDDDVLSCPPFPAAEEASGYANVHTHNCSPDSNSPSPLGTDKKASPMTRPYSNQDPLTRQLMPIMAKESPSRGVQMLAVFEDEIVVVRELPVEK